MGNSSPPPYSSKQAGFSQASENPLEISSAKLPGGLLGSAAAWSWSEFRDQNKAPASASHSSTVVMSATPAPEPHISALVLVSEF